jgi:hypothetical protein
MMYQLNKSNKTTERNDVSTEHKDIKLLNVMMYQPNIKT